MTASSSPPEVAPGAHTAGPQAAGAQNAPPAWLKEIEQELSQLGVTIGDFCGRARIASTSWLRWRKGQFEPRFGTRRRIDETLAVLRRDAARGPPK